MKKKEEKTANQIGKCYSIPVMNCESESGVEVDEIPEVIPAPGTVVVLPCRSPRFHNTCKTQQQNYISGRKEMFYLTMHSRHFFSQASAPRLV